MEKTNIYIYAVYIQSEVTQPVTLTAYKSKVINGIYLCEKPLVVSPLYSKDNFKDDDFGEEFYTGSGTIFYYLDRDEAIAKYCQERDRRIKICIAQMKSCERCVRDMQNWNPYSIEGQNTW